MRGGGEGEGQMEGRGMRGGGEGEGQMEGRGKREEMMREEMMRENGGIGEGGREGDTIV